MDNPRPQLNRDELRLGKWLLGQLLVLISAWSVVYLEINAWVWLAVIQIGVVATLISPALPTRIPSVVHRLAFPLIVGIFAWDLYATGQVLPALVRLALSLICYRTVIHRARREDLQLVVLGLFIVMVTGVLTVSLMFAAQIALFTALSLALLFNLTLLEAHGRAAPGEQATLQWTQVGWGRFARRVRQCADWRMLLLGGALFAGVVALTAALFTAIPRYQISNSMFLDRLVPGKSTSGFTDTLRFGEVSDLQKDETVALRVEAPDRAALPAQPYWRMVVMDEYRDQAFRLSDRLRREQFERKEAVRSLERFSQVSGRKATSGAWTFYLEAGVGRWLPLSGGFRRLVFAEPQDVRIGRGLGLLELEREPSSLKAYRVEGMQMSDVWPESAGDEGEAGLAGRWRGLTFDVGDREKVERWVKEILGEQAVRPSSEAFAKRAMNWIKARHSYGLQMQLPEGKGDVLVRWMESTQPGHCELFAGAFVVLARAAGYSVRVVGGYVGGTWNGDYLMVKNSHAHAWAEILEPGKGWVRVDPTASSVGAADGQSLAASGMAGNRVADASGWSATMDRVRMLWYRRVVNFEQSDQLELLQSTTAKAKKWTAGIGSWVEGIAASLKAWWQSPWSGGRVLKDMAWMLGVGVAAWVLWTQGRRLWRLRLAMAGEDPVRREAGRWLQRLAATSMPESASEAASVREQLNRLRYAARETWDDPIAVFREARQVARRSRR